MKLRNLLFGRSSRDRRWAQTMNSPRAEGKGAQWQGAESEGSRRHGGNSAYGRGDGAYGGDTYSKGGTVCNPPDRETKERKGGSATSRRWQGDRDTDGRRAEIDGGCTPYGKLLPDAESYTRYTADRGNDPYIFELGKIAKAEENFRNTLWTGEKMQIVSMAVPRGEEIPPELHNATDQLIIVFGGEGEVQVGRSEGRLTPLGRLTQGSSVIIPAGMWHRIKNTSSSPLKLISIYSPPHHPYGTVEK